MTEAMPFDARTAEFAVMASILERRHSCRSFQSRIVPGGTIDQVLHAAQRTASWCNAQPCQVTILSGRALDRLRDGLTSQAKHGKPNPDIPFPHRYQGVYRDRRKDCGQALCKSLGIGREDREEAEAQRLQNFCMFGAPHVAAIFAPRNLEPYALLDCGAYVANFINAATSLGIATIPQAAPAHYGLFIRQSLNISDEMLFVCVISFGYAEHGHPANSFRTSREKVDTVLKFME